MQIHQGEQYSIPVKITSADGTVITPSNCSDVRIKINDVLKSYSDEELTYDSTNKVWKYSLTEDETLEFDSRVSIESAVKFSDDTIVKSGVQRIDVRYSLIKETWDE